LRRIHFVASVKVDQSALRWQTVLFAPPPRTDHGRGCGHVSAELGSFDNPYAMTILHFIRQSTRVSAEEFDHLMRQHGMAGLLSAPPTIARGTAPKGSTPTSGRRPAAAAHLDAVEVAEADVAAGAAETAEEGNDQEITTAAAEGIDQGITTVGEAAAVV
jgi:hypothetical protein